MDKSTAQAEVQSLFLRYAANLRGFIVAVFPEETESQNVFQEVFLTAFAKAEDFQKGSNFLAWARAIAKNKILERLRQRQKSPVLLDGELLEVMAVANQEMDDRWAERKAALAFCVEELAPRTREIVEMRYADEPVAPGEIARRLSWSANAVYVALSKARAFLQDCTRRRLGLEEA